MLTQTQQRAVTRMIISPAAHIRMITAISGSTFANIFSAQLESGLAEGDVGAIVT